ncbi:Ras association domain-containing protein 3 [Bagarius yarrelli]|uniref:Ras association domain-containing protein 3 n=1 Tax=Bagarius yarrelli TaxID=175774 RepID=A0A556TH89_BAGYA|nr:Ras association domain-containing protein 3 [Bagarius yarrelli]
MALKWDICPLELCGFCRNTWCVSDSSFALSASENDLIALHCSSQDAEKEKDLRTHLSYEEIRHNIDLYNAATRDHFKMTLLFHCGMSCLEKRYREKDFRPQFSAMEKLHALTIVCGFGSAGLVCGFVGRRVLGVRVWECGFGSAGLGVRSAWECGSAGVRARLGVRECVRVWECGSACAFGSAGVRARLGVRECVRVWECGSVLFGSAECGSACAFGSAGQLQHTVQQVIEALLHKFTVADNPAKFALYKRFRREDHEAEHPLLLRLLAGPDLDTLSFVLREQQTGEVLNECKMRLGKLRGRSHTNSTAARLFLHLHLQGMEGVERTARLHEQKKALRESIAFTR